MVHIYEVKRHSCGSTSSFCQDDLNSDNLQHKCGFVYSQMKTTTFFLPFPTRGFSSPTIKQNFLLLKFNLGGLRVTTADFAFHKENCCFIFRKYSLINLNFRGKWCWNLKRSTLSQQNSTWKCKFSKLD